jgi:hypothetical protein
MVVGDNMNLGMPVCMQDLEWPEKLWAVCYDDGTFFCLYDCIVVLSSEGLLLDFLTALEDDEEHYRGGRGKLCTFDNVRDEAVRRGCGGLILVDVPERPRTLCVK